MSTVTSLREPLRKLAQDTSRASLTRLWRAMCLDERTRGLAAFLADSSNHGLRGPLVREIASARHFRPQTVERWPQEKLSQVGAKLDLSHQLIIEKAIVALHMRERRQLLASFLDTLGIPNANGAINDGCVPVTPLDAGKLRTAANRVADAFDINEVVLYLLALVVLYPTPFGRLDSWFQELLENADEPSFHLLPSFQRPPAQPSVVADVNVEGFTTLDRRLILSVVDAAGGVIGAPSLDEIDDMLLELEQLSGRRHQTFFHAGLRDGLFNREVPSRLPAENDARRKWYWAGFISALARAEEWPSIATLFDKEPTIRGLGKSGDGAADVAAWLVFRALCEEQRYGEAADFAQPPAARRSDKLREWMLRVSVDLIRTHRAAEARPMLDTLWTCFEGRANEVDDAELFMMVDVQRRRALCLRQLGEKQEAMRLLRSLMAYPDPRLQSIARTDIGLINTGRRRLGEFTLPSKRDELGVFVDDLRRGEPEFRAAIENGEFKPAHASFALGVLALATENFADAAHHLDLALSYFSTTPAVYRLDGTLGLTSLYLGVSICQDLDTGRLARACELIRQGLSEGARLPTWMIRSTIDAVALGNADLASATAGDFLSHGGDAVLDELIASSAATSSSEIWVRLFARAANPSRPVKRRVHDYRRALPWLLESQDLERARDALAYLEERAIEGIEPAAFIELIGNSAGYCPAWTEERATEARVRLLETEGRYEEAAGQLESICNRLLASDDEHALDDAALLLTHLEGYGDRANGCVDRLRSVLDAKWAQREADSSLDSAELARETPVRILVVGGNEQQARMDESIREKLKERHSNVTVEFIHSGFSGNWRGYLEEFERRVKQADGVVMLTLMRTMLGWSIRGRCAVPWRGVRGGGQGAILGAIDHVVPMARRYMAAQVRGRSIGVQAS